MDFCSLAKVYNAAIYCRLSKDDGDKTESDGISSQRNLLLDYLKDMSDIRLCSERVDDGYSGVDFNRPALMAMLEDIKEGRINCIVVKDLSRFSRNYIEAGRYIEKIFPFMGVRFIAVNDNYDSAQKSSYSDDILIPFKNLVNDAYCRDISVKIRSQLEIKRKKGDFTGSFAAYGYLKSGENKNKLVIDPYASKIVKDIFGWKAEGLSLRGIANRLDEIGEPSPMEYKRALGMRYATGFKQNAKARWSAAAVGRILKNPVYTGALVQGRISTPNHKIKQRFTKPADKWIRVENTHEPIITEDIFQTVGLLLRTNTRIAPRGESVQLFSGLLFCADCRQRMVRKTVPAGDKKYIYHVCSTYKAGKGCTSHSVSETAAEEAVLKAIQAQIAAFADVERILKLVDKLHIRQEEIKKTDAQLAMKQEEIRKCKKLKVSLYEDLKNGIVSKDEHREFRAIYEHRLVKTVEAAGRLKQLREHILSGKAAESVWTEGFDRYRNIRGLSRKIAVFLIERIYVYENGKKSRIEIKFRYRSESEACTDSRPGT